MLLLAACKSEDQQMRDGFEPLCAAVTKAKADPEALRKGEVLLRAAHELAANELTEEKKNPVFERFMDEMATLDQDTRHARFTEKIEALGLTSKCGDFLYYVGPGGPISVDIETSAEYLGEGFRINNHGRWLHPWREGDYAKVWERGGVVLTPGVHYGDRQRLLISIEPSDFKPSEAKPSDCEQQARAQLASRGRQLTDAGLHQWLQTPREGVIEVCLFGTERGPEHAGLSGAIFEYGDTTLLVVCEGDARWPDHRRDCEEELKRSLAPAPGKRGVEMQHFGVRIYDF